MRNNFHIGQIPQGIKILPFSFVSHINTQINKFSCYGIIINFFLKLIVGLLFCWKKCLHNQTSCVTECGPTFVNFFVYLLFTSMYLSMMYLLKIELLKHTFFGIYFKHNINDLIHISCFYHS